MRQNQYLKGFWTRNEANNSFSKDYFSGLMSLYAECKVRVDNNKLQDQVLMTYTDWAGYQE